MIRDIHTLLTVALLVPFVALGIAVAGTIFAIAWRGKIGGRS